GASNAFFGFNAGATNDDGANNTFVGANSGLNNFHGNNNTYLGRNTGASNANGSNVTLIGSDANVPQNSSLIFATAIGAGSVVLEDNTVALGRGGGADTVVAYGKMRVNILGAAGSTQLCR